MWSEAPDGGVTMALIGESPGAEEAEEKRPFVGPAGRFLNHALYEADVNRKRLHVTNVIACRPPENELDSPEGIEAQECCRPGFLAELDSLEKAGVKVLVPLGSKPLRALGISEGITRARGSVYQWKKIPVLPTFHPSFILRGAYKEEGTWIGDFVKAREIATEGWKPPRERFDLFPSISSLAAFVELALKLDSPVAVDIETTSLSPDSGAIVVIGLGLPDRVITVPFLKKGGSAYWPPNEYNVVLELLRKIFSQKELVFQNAPFDASWLMFHGFRIGKTPHDVLLAHHTIHPELAHNLGYIVSVYGKTPFWKGEMLDRAEKILAVEDETLRRYNARDTAVLHEVLPGLLADLDEFGLRHVYETIARKMILPVVEMNLSGLLVDKKALERWRRSLASRYAHLSEKIKDLCRLPPAFSLSSDDDLRLLIYGTKAAKFKRAEEALDAYDANPRLRRDTKKYAELMKTFSVLDGTKPLYQPRCTGRTTDTGKASVSAEALLARKIACNNRLAGIKGLKEKDAREERAEVEKAISFFTLLDEWNEVDKLRSTYTRFPTWKDGRVHGSYLIHGTKTGRLCVDPETLVEAPRDLSLFPQGVPLRSLKKGDVVYSFDEEKNLCLRRVVWVGPTEKKPTLIVHTDDGPDLRLSRDHLVRKWSGEWVHAKDLKEGDRLLCMPPRGDHDGYSVFFPHSRNRKAGGGRVLEHRFIYEQLNGRLRGNSLIHHRDGNKKDNSPLNLEWCAGIGAHLGKHSYANDADRLEEAVSTGIGKRGTRLSTETLRKYRGKLRRNHVVTGIEDGPTMQLWDLEVEGTHCFIGSDIALHNSSKNPNMQNIPEEARHIFIAKPGHVLLGPDYSNLELRVIALASGDAKMLATFAKGGSVHDENTRDLFGIDKDSPLWKAARSAQKTYIFGRKCYGGTLRGIYEKIMNKAPELGLTWNAFLTADKRFDAAHPELAAWGLRQQEIGLTTRRVTNAFGRLRILLGDDSEVEREAMNTPIQGTAADIANLALIAIYEEFKKKDLRAKIVGQVHDQILVEAPRAELATVKRILKKHMERGHTLWSRTATFPIEMKVGSNWGSLEEV